MNIFFNETNHKLFLLLINNEISNTNDLVMLLLFLTKKVTSLILPKCKNLIRDEGINLNLIYNFTIIFGKRNNLFQIIKALQALIKTKLEEIHILGRTKKPKNKNKTPLVIWDFQIDFAELASSYVYCNGNWKVAPTL